MMLSHFAGGRYATRRVGLLVKLSKSTLLDAVQI